tara:strand:- start:1123 stop:1611 length:489 start_codon:yes stop_codon:yes gene_type:complete
MTPETLEWLSHKVPGFVELTAEERNAIDDFSFLWSLFEGSEMNRHCSIQSIRQYVSDLEQSGRLDEIDCEAYLAYLKDRYFNNGQVTEHFPYLRLERNHNPEEVMDALSNENATKVAKVIGSLIIVYRLRNNLFHGEKWLHQLHDERNNFTFANGFLKSLMC